jgi:DNA polymerase-3 subunit beta
MKVICSKENLSEGINIVQKAVSSKTTLQILEGILIEAGDSLKLTGNDLEIGIECFIQADVRETGSVVINAKMFGDIVRRFPDAEVSIEVSENNMVLLECENSRFEIKGMSASGFPAINHIPKENAFVISQKMLREMIRQTIFAVSVDENRPILTGSLIECRNNELSIVSIDGFRLALRKNSLNNDTGDWSVVVPGKTLNEIIKIFQPVESDVSIYCTDNQIMFDLGDCRIVSRLLEGEYFNYRGIIPEEYDTTLKIGTKELLSSIERASLIITIEERRFPVKFNVGDDIMTISCSTDAGSFKEELRCETTGSKIDIVFNPKYFIDTLRVIEEEQIELKYTTSVGPCTVTPVDTDSFTYLILPLRK